MGHAKSMVRHIAAYVCLVIGVAGLALPLLPGIPFLILGLSLLRPDHPVRRMLARWIPRKSKSS